METFSAYARQFIGNLERPDVDKINGLNLYFHRTETTSPESTVKGWYDHRESYDFMRFFTPGFRALSYVTGEKKWFRYTEQQIVN